MSAAHRTVRRTAVALATVWLCAMPAPTRAQQRGGPSTPEAEDLAAFKDFSARVQTYVKLQRTAESSLPALKPTDLPAAIAAHQQALEQKIREARPRAARGDIFTSDACEAFRRASRATLEGPRTANSLAYMQPGAPNPGMRLVVNGTYPDTEPVTALSPTLLAAFPPLPVEVAYRVVGRTLMLIDVKSSLIVDFARLILPPAS